MPANLSYGVRGHKRLDAPVRTLSVSAGSIVVNAPSEGGSLTVTRGQDHTFDPPLAGIDTYAPYGARVHVTYGDDPVDTEQERNQPGTAKKRSTAKKSAPKKAAKKRTSSSKKPASKTAKKAPAKKAAKRSRKRG